MSIPNTDNREDYEGTGTSDTFSYGWKIFKKQQLKVIQRVNATGVETTLVVDVDHSFLSGF